MTGFINESDETSKRMVSKYEESASNIDNIEEIIQGLNIVNLASAVSFGELTTSSPA